MLPEILLWRGKLRRVGPANSRLCTTVSSRNLDLTPPENKSQNSSVLVDRLGPRSLVDRGLHISQHDHARSCFGTGPSRPNRFLGLPPCRICRGHRSPRGQGNMGPLCLMHDRRCAHKRTRNSEPAARLRHLARQERPPLYDPQPSVDGQSCAIRPESSALLCFSAPRDNIALEL